VEAVPALIKALKDPDSVVHSYAARALGKIGPGAKPAIAALKEALQDSDPDVDDNAAEALAEIGAG
jgi:HEAT repeat protein